MAGPGPNLELVPDFPPKLVGEGPLPNEANSKALVSFPALPFLVDGLVDPALAKAFP